LKKNVYCIVFVDHEKKWKRRSNKELKKICKQNNILYFIVQFAKSLRLSWAGHASCVKSRWFNYYDSIGKSKTNIDFWTLYNRHVIKKDPEELKPDWNGNLDLTHIRE